VRAEWERRLALAGRPLHLTHDSDRAPRVHLQLADIAEQLDTALARFRRLVAATPDASWSARRDPMSWSVAECVAHLNLTSRAYVPALRKALDEARTVGAPAPRHYRRTMMGWMLSATTGPLPAIGRVRIGRVRTAPAFVPQGDLPKAALVADFEGLQRDQFAIVREADGLPLDRVRVPSAFVERVSYDAYSALLILPRHQHRHLQQAEFVWRA
jgi:hypothetical protein